MINMKICFKTIGFVKNAVEAKKDVSWGEEISYLILDEEYEEGLKGLSDFSYITLIYYLDKAKFDKDKHLVRRPQNREDMPLVGIFAQRAKDRPNPIGMTSVELVAVEKNIITVRGLDAIDGTPILDIKPYYPMYDCKEKVRIPEWVSRLMEHYF